VAFARAFQLPLTWFFMPPLPWAGPGTPTKLAVPDAPASGEPLAVLVDLVFGDQAQQAQLSLRLDAFLADLGPADLTQAQTRITSLADQRVAALLSHAFTNLAQWRTSLRSIADQLEDLDLRAQGALAREIGHPAEAQEVLTEMQPAREPAADPGNTSDTQPDSIGTPHDVDGDQQAPPSVRTGRPPFSTDKSTTRSS
jgi:hypothetical protein